MHSFKKDQIVEVEVKTRRGPARWIGQVIKVTPTRVQFYYMRQSFMGFALIRRWALLAEVFPATAKNKRVWNKATMRNNELVKAIRDAYVEDSAEGYASSL